MKPIMFPEATCKIAEHQDEYLTLPAFVDSMCTISLWELSWKERLKILWTGKLWLRQLNMGQALQPQCPEVDYPFVQLEK